MFALFTAIPFVGHLNPLLVQAQELQRRGWRVAVASFDTMRDHVARESPTVPFVGLGPLGGREALLRREMETASAMSNFATGAMHIGRALTTLWPEMFDALGAAITRDRPDVIVADVFTPAAVCAADLARVPVVLNNPALLHMLPAAVVAPLYGLPSALSGKTVRDAGVSDRVFTALLRTFPWLPQLANGTRRIHAMRRARRLPAVDVDARLRGRPILVTSAFGFEYGRALPPDIEMIGPCLPTERPPLSAEWDHWLSDGAPVVYANLGTVAVPHRRVIATMADAFAALPYRVLWVLRPSLATRLPRPLPSHVRVLEWGPPLRAVLAHPQVHAFVSHCGPNSVYESIDAGTPIVGIPMFADQSDVAARVADAGLGLRLDKRRFTAGELIRAIERVMTDASFDGQLSIVQQALARTGGARQAAGIIEHTAVSGGAALRVR